MLKILFYLALFAAFISFATTGRAAQSSGGYRFQVGDEISITDLKAMTTEPIAVTVPVAPDGLLHLPFPRLGAVQAEGKTMDEVKKAVYDEFKKIYKRPDILVVPKKITGGSKVAILGPVEKPGRYSYRSDMTVMDALSAAEGFREKANPTRIYIVRGGLENIITINLRKLLSGDRQENRKLEADDVVIVQEQQGHVTVFGSVEKPGVFPCQEGMRIAQAIALSEGFKSGAELRRLVVLRQGEKIPVNFLLMQETGDQTQNIALQPDDTVFVPKANRAVVVVGGVKEPGSYEFEDGARILSAIGLAKGFDEQADRSGVVRVKRRGQELKVDLGKTRREANADDNGLLEPNDIVIVPLRGGVTVVGEVRQAGTYTMKPDMRLADAIGLSGGWTPQSNRNVVKIFRAGQVLNVDAQRLENGDTETNVRLEAGDTVLVTALQGVSVFGAVGQPGTVPLPEDPRVFNVLAAAHGWLTQQAAEEATVLRTENTPNGKKLIPLVINLKKLQAGDPSQNTVIKPGDVIIVPFKKEPQTPNRTQNVLSLLSSVSYLRFLFSPSTK